MTITISDDKMTSDDSFVKIVRISKDDRALIMVLRRITSLIRHIPLCCKMMWR